VPTTDGPRLPAGFNETEADDDWGRSTSLAATRPHRSLPALWLGPRDVYQPSSVAASSNVVAVLVPIKRIAAKQTTTIRANMTEYSTAVGPPSDTRNRCTFAARAFIESSVTVSREAEHGRSVRQDAPSRNCFATADGYGIHQIKPRSLSTEVKYSRNPPYPAVQGDICELLRSVAIRIRTATITI